MAKQFGINAGQEMIQGIESAKEMGAHLVLADRNIQITFLAFGVDMGLGERLMLLTEVIASIFSKESITEEELEKMKNQDTINCNS